MLLSYKYFSVSNSTRNVVTVQLYFAALQPIMQFSFYVTSLSDTTQL